MDYVLGTMEDSGERTSQVDDWITEHHKRLAEAFNKASEKTEKEALRRTKANETNLPVGARVFLRNRVIKGRNKIQDVWKATPHKVGQLSTGGNTYVVEPLIGGLPRKTVHRSELLDARDLVKDMKLDQTRNQ